MCRLLPPVGIKGIWVRERLRVSVQTETLRRNGHAGRDEMSRQLQATRRDRPGETGGEGRVQAEGLIDTAVQVGGITEVVIGEVLGEGVELPEQPGADVREAADAPDEVDHAVGGGVAAADDKHLRVVADLGRRPRLLHLGRVDPAEDGRVLVLAAGLVDADLVPVQGALGIVKGAPLDLGCVTKDGDGEDGRDLSDEGEHGSEAAYEAEGDEICHGTVLLLRV